MVRGPGKVYSDELKVRLTGWARRSIAAGSSLGLTARAIGLDPRTLAAWLGTTAATATRRWTPASPVALVPVEVVEPAATAAMLTLVSPSGYRLEGLTFDDAVRALARLG